MDDGRARWLVVSVSIEHTDVWDVIAEFRTRQGAVEYREEVVRRNLKLMASGA